MTLFRAIHDKKHPYTIINKTITTDSRLSWKAKGIWMYAFSRPDNWTFSYQDLLSQSLDGPDSLRSGLKELKKCGYLKIVPVRKNGTFCGQEWHFFETPQIQEKITELGVFRSSGKGQDTHIILSNEEEEAAKQPSLSPGKQQLFEEILNDTEFPKHLLPVEEILCILQEKKNSVNDVAGALNNILKDIRKDKRNLINNHVALFKQKVLKLRNLRLYKERNDGER